jgi:hypothetical protein
MQPQVFSLERESGFIVSRGNGNIRRNSNPVVLSRTKVTPLLHLLPKILRGFTVQQQKIPFLWAYSMSMSRYELIWGEKNNWSVEVRLLGEETEMERIE